MKPALLGCVNAAARAAAFACVVLVGACPAANSGSDDDSGDVTGLGDPCTSDGVAGDLCLGDLVCVEASAGSGGVCEAPPADCIVDDDAFCQCDLTPLCAGGALPDCYVLESRRGVICG